MNKINKITKTPGLTALNKLEKSISGMDAALIASKAVENLGRGMGKVLPLYTVTYIDHWINSAKLSLRQRRTKPNNRKA